MRAMDARMMRMGLLGLLMVGMLAAGACRSGGGNDEVAERSNERWLSMRSSLMLEMAHQQFETGDLDRAEQTVREATQMDPTNAGLYALGGRIMLERDRLERAYHMFQAALSQDEELATAHYYLGVVMQRWQRFDAAHAAYARAYAIEPDESSYLMATGEMLVELGRNAEAIELFESNLRYFDQNASLRAALGHLYLVGDDPARAVRYFREAAVLDPTDDTLRYEMALARAAAGDHPQAIRDLRGLLDEDRLGERRDLRRALARSYRAIGQLDEARRELTRLARSEGAGASDWQRLAELSWHMGEVSDTLFAARRVIEIDPRMATGYLLAGIALSELDKLDEAVVMFDRAIALDSEDASGLILRGIALERSGQASAAAASYQAVLERYPEDRRVQRLLERVGSETN
ncbi:MAG: tetratricopeptide repeat protein [Phycisphaeraceae bacterium]